MTTADCINLAIAIGTFLGAIGTISAVIVALVQANKGSSDARKIQKRNNWPVLYPMQIGFKHDWVDDDHENAILKRVGVRIQNFGTGPALDVYVQFYAYGHTIRHTMRTVDIVFADGPSISMFANNDTALIPADGSDEFQGEIESSISIPLPCKVTGHVHYRTIYGDEISKSFMFDIPKPLEPGTRGVTSPIRIYNVSSEQL